MIRISTQDIGQAATNNSQHHNISIVGEGSRYLHFFITPKAGDLLSRPTSLTKTQHHESNRKMIGPRGATRHCHNLA